MVMSASAVRDLVGDDLAVKLRTQRTRMDGWDKWLTGDNPVERLAHQDPNATRNQLVELSRTPMLRQIVEQLAQQLVLASVVSPSATEQDVGRLWAPWDANGCPTRQSALYEAMIGYGRAYALTLPGEAPVPDPSATLRLREDRALIRFLSPRNLLVIESSDPFDEWPTMALWEIPQAADASRYRLIEPEGQHFLGRDEAGRLEYAEFRPWGVGVTPVVTYSNHLDLEGRSAGEVERNETVARRYDKTVHDRLLIQHNNSWRVKTATGLDDPGTTEEKDRLKAQLRHDDVLTGGEGVQFGSLPETTLDSTLKAAEADQETLSAMAQVTIWSLNSSKLINLSADALAEARSLNRLKTQALQRSAGRSHANLLRLAAHIEGRAEDAARFDMSMEWENVEAQALSAIADGLSKLQNLGVPNHFLWELIPGVSSGKLAQWRRYAEEHPSDAQVLADVLGRQITTTA